MHCCSLLIGVWTLFCLFKTTQSFVSSFQSSFSASAALKKTNSFNSCACMIACIHVRKVFKESLSGRLIFQCGKFYWKFLLDVDNFANGSGCTKVTSTYKNGCVLVWFWLVVQLSILFKL